MSTGILSNRFSFVGRYGFKALGLAVLAAGLVLGGCNGKLKEENAALRDENAQIKESLKSTETEKAALSTQVQQTQAEKDRLAMELASAKSAPAPMAPAGFQQTTGNDTWNNPTGGSRTGGGRSHSGNGGGERIVIAGDTLFAPGQASLKSDAKKSIDRVLSQVKSASSVRIEGYTDSDPIKNAAVKKKYPTNTALSKARADAVKSYLVSRGVSSGKITTVGKGSENPKETKQASRRVEIVVAE